MRTMTPLFALAGLALLVWIGAAVALDRFGQIQPPTGVFDALVVAGCRVDPSGQPSLALQRRTALAVDLWRGGQAPRVVFTGGVGAYPPSEASAAADYAAELGLPRAAMTLEERSTSTEENARLSAKLLRAAAIPDARILVVTDAYHVFRAERVFRRYFAEVHGVGSTPAWGVRVRGAMREVLAAGAYAVRGRLSETRARDDL